MNNDKLSKSQVLVRNVNEILRFVWSNISERLVVAFGFLVVLYLIFAPPVPDGFVFALAEWNFYIPLRVLLAVFILLLIFRIQRQIASDYKNYLWKDLELQEQIQEAERAAVEQPKRTRPAWQAASFTLERYYLRNLFQNGMVFGLSVGIIIVGFVLIVYAILMALSDPLANTISIAVGIAGIITEVIGASCLLVFKSTVEQSLRYATILERTSTIGMALAILDTISTEDNQKVEEVTAAKIEIATKLITQVPSIN